MGTRANIVPKTIFLPALSFLKERKARNNMGIMRIKD
jgi:hypothetical protein